MPEQLLAGVLQGEMQGIVWAWSILEDSNAGVEAAETTLMISQPFLELFSNLRPSFACGMCL